MPNPKESKTWAVQAGGVESHWIRASSATSNEQRWIDDDGNLIIVCYVGDQVFVKRHIPTNLQIYYGQTSIEGDKISGKFLSANTIGEKPWSAEICYERQATP